MPHSPATPATSATPAEPAAQPVEPVDRFPDRLTRRVDSFRPYALSAFRIVVGLLYACHGFGALFGVIGPASGSGPGGPGGGPDVETVAAWDWPVFYAAVIELVGGGLLVLGVGTRAVAFICSGEMAYAYFTVHAEIDLWPIDNGGEIPAFYSWAFLLLVFTGPGALTLGRLFRRARRARRSG